MSKLYLKGISKPLIIKPQQARNLGLMMESDTMSPKTKVDIGGIRFLKEDIRYVIENDFEDDASEASENRKEENDEYYGKVDLQYNVYIKNLCGRPLEAKISDLKMYEMVWACFVSTPMETHHRDTILERQRDFYNHHPKHPYASINIFDLLPKGKGEELLIKSIMPVYASKKLEEMIAEAYRTARYLKII